MREKRKKSENLLCKNCLISFHEIREYQACNIGKRKYDIKKWIKEMQNSMLLSESKKAILLY